MFRSYVSDNPVRLTICSSLGLLNLRSKSIPKCTAVIWKPCCWCGCEVLYRPLGKNWALGLDANLISQRDPDSCLLPLMSRLFITMATTPLTANQTMLAAKLTCLIKAQRVNFRLTTCLSGLAREHVV
ncbi:YjbH domain-containing protein [Vibrio vulnificus]|uniref:YjbH domain-containing protein n=1 Tax=Vibrio vulnificus TaxID=672 RepID=UPI003BF85689